MFAGGPFLIGLLSRGALGLLLLIAVLAVTFLAYRAHRQNASAAALAIRTPNGIDEGLFVRAGGIDQWVSIRGEDRSNPVVLVLHGGPATSYMAFTTFFQPWEKYFTVVQWDRRGVGKTFGRNGRARSGQMTLDRIVEDGAEISGFLCRHLHKDKIILLGHSMGSMIGISIAARRPDLFYAYVGTEQIVDMARNEELSYQTILNSSRTAGNASTVKTLERIGAPPYQRALDWGAKQKAAEVADPVSRRTSGPRPPAGIGGTVAVSTEWLSEWQLQQATWPETAYSPRWTSENRALLDTERVFRTVGGGSRRALGFGGREG